MFLQYSYDKLITNNIKNTLREYSVADRFRKEKKKNRDSDEHALYSESRKSSKDVVCSKYRKKRHKKDKNRSFALVVVVPSRIAHSDPLHRAVRALH